MKTVAAIKAFATEPGDGATLDQLQRSGAICHPEVFHWYFQVRNGLPSVTEHAGGMRHLPLLISESRERASQTAAELGVAIDIAPIGPGTAEALKHGAAYARRLAGEEVSLQPLSEWSPEVKARLKDTLAMIRQTWSEIYDELPLVVQKLIVYRGHAVIGFTDFRYHGSVFFKYEWLMKRPHLEEVAEDIIHEAAHVRLNAIMATTPLFRNDDQEIYPSPLRRDLRSMYGVFHQMYVLRRVVEWYRRLEQQAPLCRPQNLAENFEDFKQAYEVVKQHADLTPAGRAMLLAIHLSELN